MKTKKTISVMIASMLLMVFSFTTANVNAQAKKDAPKSKDCCIMKDGKMMTKKDGKMEAMDKDMTMSNGSICAVNGEVTMKDGKKVMLTEGEAIGMDGKIKKCTKPKTEPKKK
jgi:ribosomal protein S4E